MAIGKTACGVKVCISPDSINIICYDHLGKSRPGVAPDSILTISRMHSYPGETYPSFQFEETERVINGLFLDLVDKEEGMLSEYNFDYSTAKNNRFVIQIEKQIYGIKTMNEGDKDTRCVSGTAIQPEWANYKATDSDGVAYWYENKPFATSIDWQVEDGRVSPVYMEIWKATLIDLNDDNTVD